MVGQPVRLGLYTDEYIPQIIFTFLQTVIVKSRKTLHTPIFSPIKLTYEAGNTAPLNSRFLATGYPSEIGKFLLYISETDQSPKLLSV